MRIARIQTYPASTQFVMYGFFCLFILTIPLYYAFYYFFMHIYILTPGPVHIKDSIYCVAQCKWVCFGIITVGNGIAMGVMAFLNTLPTRYISKSIAYIIGVFSLPVFSTIVYFCVWGLVTTRIMDHLTSMFLGVCITFLLGLGGSLLPPFCRRRAHVLVRLLNPHVELFKLAIRLSIDQNYWICFLPWGLCMVYLMFLWGMRTQKSSIDTTLTEEIVYKLLCLMGSFIIRIAVVYKGIFHIFNLPRSSTKPLTPMVLVYVGLLGVFNALYAAEFVTDITDTYGYPWLKIAMCFMRMYLEWAIPIQFLSITVAREYITSRHFGRKWIKANLKSILFFDICRFYVCIPAIILPFTITYYIFDKFHERTISEISIVISFTRLSFSYIYVYLDGVLRILFLGERLRIPFRLPKRVTYTDIANTYDTISRITPESHSARTQAPHTHES